MSSSPYDRCTLPPAGPARPPLASASPAASRTVATGSSPSRSPSKRSPTSAIVLPAEQRRGPAVLADDVVDELSHVPLGARRRIAPTGPP